MFASSWTGPMYVWNMRLKRRGADSGPASTGHFRPSRWTTVSSWSSVADSDSAPGSSSSRNRRRHVAHSTSGSEKEPTWPDVTHTWGCIRMPASSPTMSSRSWTMARHQARLTLFLSSTPSGP